MSDADLMAPLRHLMEVPGKGFRPKMIEAFNQWLKVDEQTVKGVVSIVEKLHTSSLLIDDIEDGSKLRRGVPVAHEIYGVAATINCANHAYFLAMQEAINLAPESTDKTHAVLVGFTEEMCNLHKGQGLDIHYRDNLYVPSEEEYLAMVQHKTGGLFRLTVGIMQVFSECKVDFKPLLNRMGAYFQILDDYMNLASGDYHKSKTFCEDITEGKYSYPIIHSIREHKKNGDERLHKIIQKGTESEELKLYALKLISQTGSFDFTLAKLNSLYAEMLEDIEGIGSNAPLLTLLNKLHAATKARSAFSFEDSEDNGP